MSDAELSREKIDLWYGAPDEIDWVEPEDEEEDDLDPPDE
jgi:hypothetical protein